MNRYYVAMIIKGREVPSSAIASGPFEKCDKIVKRQNRGKKHESVSFGLFRCAK
jgi:hypothetical protein